MSLQVRGRDRGRVRLRSCGLILREDAILLVRLNTPTRPHPVWMPPGGEVRLGESLEETLRREVREETGLQVEPVRLSMIYEFVEPPWHALEFYFLCRAPDRQPVLGSDPDRSPQSQILQEVRYCRIRELKRLEIHPRLIVNDHSRLFATEGPVVHSKNLQENR